MRMYDFTVENNKWKCYISGKFAWYMFSTYGFPPEMIEEEVIRLNKLNPKSRLIKIMQDWKQFVEEFKLE